MAVEPIPSWPSGCPAFWSSSRPSWRRSGLTFAIKGDAGIRHRIPSNDRMGSMTSTASREHDLHLWSLVVRGITWLQLGLGACYFAAFLLYGYARLTIGSHDLVVGGNYDPKALGSGFGNVVAWVLHVFGVGAAVTSPYAGVLFGLLVLPAYMFSQRVRADSAIRTRVVVALCVSVAVAIVGSMDAVSDIRHWMLD